MIFIRLAIFLRNLKLSEVLKLKKEKRFVDHDTSVEDYMESLEKKNTKEKTKRDVKLLETFLRNEKSDEREVQNIDAAELNKHLTDFIRSLRRINAPINSKLQHPPPPRQTPGI